MNSSPEPDSYDVVVVGAGIAGLCAAGELTRAGRRVLVLEKSRGVGGRMATRRLGQAVCDHGAQFFTVRGQAFGALVAEAHDAGAVATWCDGFWRQGSLDGGGAGPGDGHPRWRGVRGMTDFPKRIAALLEAAGCDIRTASKVAAIGIEAGRVRVVIEGEAAARSEFMAAGAVLTSPVPQSLDLLAAGTTRDDGNDAIDALSRRRLEMVAYDPCFTLMLVLDRPSKVPAPGGIQFGEGATGPIAWVADNMQKGISPVPALTLHATGAFSREHFDTPADDVATILVDAARPWIDGDPAVVVVERSLQRWKFALPTTLIAEPFAALATAPPVVCCGDAFAGPRVEGAAASGLAAGQWMAGVLP